MCACVRCWACRVDLQNATQPFLSRGFGVAKASYFAHHNAALECVRAKLLPKHLSTHYTAGLCNKFVHVFIEDWDDKYGNSVRWCVCGGACTCGELMPGGL